MKKEIVVIGLLVLLLFSSIAAGVGSENVNGNAMKIGDGGVKEYTTHGVIRINNDTDFANQALQEGWSGDGSQSNPYVISGYDIDALGAGDAIYIGNTTSYFIVENCYLHNASYHSWPYFEGDGIMLYNVANGTVVNSNISNNWDGVRLESYSEYNHIEDNILTQNGGSGLSMNYYCSNNTFNKNNMFNNTQNGIWIKYSNNNVIFNNNIHDNGQYGMELIYSNYNNLYSNIISNNTR